MLDLAGILGGGFLIHSQGDEKTGQKGVPLVDLFRDLKPRVREMDRAVLVDGDIASAF